MIYIVINHFQIALATLAGLAVGYVWHLAVGKGRLTGGTVVVAAIAGFWLAAILAGALILAPKQADPLIMAIGSGVVIWAGFVVPSLALTLRYRAQSWGVVAADLGHWLLVMVVQAIVLHSLGLTPPPTP
ncbi:DUF1761 domain-containing protein [Glacieibacterium frigidum]|uniref:DUF1761 domain-containing protein n=1 Tax=Glacieibacterium frigidum TaxID=2593303 RepID=A0A552UIY1_9SPHN|nr:DUF1761 domain-containing protein [Glacieibacterium frigidum]TRW18186.1 DUF1761 domain-containing protein [Glacieibacterium frigidum]